jgi:hypothetical protein
MIKVKDFDCENALVKAEADRIDILIMTKKKAIIFENKIGAGDQDKQLERYVDKVKRNFSEENITVCYLTLYGHEPSAESLGELKKEVKCISYENDIFGWIENCRGKCHESFRPLLETLFQYQNLIKKLTG